MARSENEKSPLKRFKDKEQDTDPLPYDTNQSPTHSITNRTGYHSTVFNISNNLIADGGPNVPVQITKQSSCDESTVQKIIEQAKATLENEYCEKKMKSGCGKDELVEYIVTDESEYEEKLSVWMNRITKMYKKMSE